MDGLVIFYAIAALLWFVALVDILKSDFYNNNKIVWLLVVFFLSTFGAVLYLTIGRGQKKV